MPAPSKRKHEVKEFEEKVIHIRRVSKKTKGGNNINFTALVVVGDRKGKVGVAMGKAPDVLSAIKKGVRKAKKRMIVTPIVNGTIPFQMNIKDGAAKVLLKPAPKGSGIIAGGAVRAVVELAGITDIIGKIMGSNNQTNNVYATFKALDEIRKIVKIKNIKVDDLKKLAAIKEERRKKLSKSEDKSKKSSKKKSSRKSNKSSSKPLTKPAAEAKKAPKAKETKAADKKTESKSAPKTRESKKEAKSTTKKSESKSEKSTTKTDKKPAAEAKKAPKAKETKAADKKTESKSK
jgi:small subunit ribosomal protein S5